MLLPFPRQEGDVLFSKTTHFQIRLLRRKVPFVVYNNCPGQHDRQISRQLNTYGTWWSGNLLFLQSVPLPLPNCDNRCKMLGTIYCRRTVCTCITISMGKHTHVLLMMGVNCVLMWLFVHPLVLSEFIIYSYNSKLPVTSIFSFGDFYIKDQRDSRTWICD